jgi:hypothetical protein
MLTFDTPSADCMKVRIPAGLQTLEEEFLETRATLIHRVDGAEAGPELRHRTACGESEGWIRIRQDGFEDEMAAHQRARARLAVTVREDHAVLAAVRSVRRRLIESIHQSERKELAREVLHRRQFCFRRRASERKAVERWHAVRQRVVA